jgi:hypothetical protein
MHLAAKIKRLVIPISFEVSSRFVRSLSHAHKLSEALCKPIAIKLMEGVYLLKSTQDYLNDH